MYLWVGQQRRPDGRWQLQDQDKALETILQTEFSANMIDMEHSQQGSIQSFFEMLARTQETYASSSRFTMLPLELRTKIWKFAIPHPRNVTVFCSGSDLKATIIDDTQAHSIVMTLLHINQEAREVVLKLYQPTKFPFSKTFYFDFGHDTLCVAGDIAMDNLFSSKAREDVKWQSQVTRFAILGTQKPVSDWGIGSLAPLTSLTDLAVYLGCSDWMRLHASRESYKALCDGIARNFPGRQPPVVTFYSEAWPGSWIRLRG